jgi:hypothetical protein
LSAATRRAIGATSAAARRHSRSRSSPTFSSAATSGANTGSHSSAACSATRAHIGCLADAHCATLCGKHLRPECYTASGEASDGNSTAE